MAFWIRMWGLLRKKGRGSVWLHALQGPFSFSWEQKPPVERLRGLHHVETHPVFENTQPPRQYLIGSFTFNGVEFSLNAV